MVVRHVVKLGQEKGEGRRREEKSPRTRRESGRLAELLWSLCPVHTANHGAAWKKKKHSHTDQHRHTQTHTATHQT